MDAGRGRLIPRYPLENMRPSRGLERRVKLLGFRLSVLAPGGACIVRGAGGPASAVGQTPRTNSMVLLLLLHGRLCREGGQSLSDS